MNHLPIENITFDSFRGLRRLTLGNCGDINLIVGDNNSGKTTVLDGVSLYCRPLDISNWREIAWQREVKSSRTRLAEPFKWLFPQIGGESEDSPKPIQISGSGRFPMRRMFADYHMFESFGGKEDVPDEEFMVQEDSEAERGLDLRVLADYALLIQGELDETRTSQNSVEFRVIDNQRFTYSTKVDEPFIKTGLISPVTHRTSQDTTSYLSQAIKNEGPEADVRESITEILREIDNGVLKFEIVDTGQTTSTVFIKHKDTGMTPVSAFGDGMRRALLIAAMIPALEGGVLLIDEIEAALHVSVLNSVLKALGRAADRYNVQVFATTHSLEAVDAIADAFTQIEGDLVTYRLAPEASGGNPVRYGGEEVRRLRFDRGLELR